MKVNCGISSPERDVESEKERILSALRCTEMRTPCQKLNCRYNIKIELGYIKRNTCNLIALMRDAAELLSRE